LILSNYDSGENKMNFFGVKFKLSDFFGGFPIWFIVIVLLTALYVITTTFKAQQSRKRKEIYIYRPTREEKQFYRQQIKHYSKSVDFKTKVRFKKPRTSSKKFYK
jgi:hypothetical protein